MLLLFSGRTAGVTESQAASLALMRDLDWRLAFLGGLIIAPSAGVCCEAACRWWKSPAARPLIAGGLLVGFGTRLGSGCTSGHGICGMGRISLRSAVAVVTFLVVGVATATLTRLGAFVMRALFAAVAGLILGLA